MIEIAEVSVEDELTDLKVPFEQHVLVACPRCVARRQISGEESCSGLLYAWRGEALLEIGDRVLCPPTPGTETDWTTIVISTNTIDVSWPGYVKWIVQRLP